MRQQRCSVRPVAPGSYEAPIDEGGAPGGLIAVGRAQFRRVEKGDNDRIGAHRPLLAVQMRVASEFSVQLALPQIREKLRDLQWLQPRRAFRQNLRRLFDFPSIGPRNASRLALAAEQGFERWNRLARLEAERGGVFETLRRRLRGGAVQRGESHCGGGCPQELSAMHGCSPKSDARLCAVSPLPERR